MGVGAAEGAARSAFYILDSGRAKRPEKEKNKSVRQRRQSNKIISLSAKQEAQIMGGKSISSPSLADEADEPRRAPNEIQVSHSLMRGSATGGPSPSFISWRSS